MYVWIPFKENNGEQACGSSVMSPCLAGTKPWVQQPAMQEKGNLNVFLVLPKNKPSTLHLPYSPLSEKHWLKKHSPTWLKWWFLAAN